MNKGIVNSYKRLFKKTGQFRGKIDREVYTITLRKVIDKCSGANYVRFPKHVRYKGTLAQPNETGLPEMWLFFY